MKRQLLTIVALMAMAPSINAMQRTFSYNDQQKWNLPIAEISKGLKVGDTFVITNVDPTVMAPNILKDATGKTWAQNTKIVYPGSRDGQTLPGRGTITFKVTAIPSTQPAAGARAPVLPIAAAAPATVMSAPQIATVTEFPAAQIKTATTETVQAPIRRVVEQPAPVPVTAVSTTLAPQTATPRQRAQLLPVSLPERLRAMRMGPTSATEAKTEMITPQEPQVAAQKPAIPNLDDLIEFLKPSILQGKLFNFENSSYELLQKIHAAAKQVYRDKDAQKYIAQQLKTDVTALLISLNSLLRDLPGQIDNASKGKQAQQPTAPRKWQY